MLNQRALQFPYMTRRQLLGLAFALHYQTKSLRSARHAHQVNAAIVRTADSTQLELELASESVADGHLIRCAYAHRARQSAWGHCILFVVLVQAAGRRIDVGPAPPTPPTP